MTFLGIDLGTGSVKAMVLDTQGCVLGGSQAHYALLTPRPGWSESSPQKWWLATISAVREVLASVAQVQIAAIGLCGQMHGVVLADEQGRPVRPALLWADIRARAELERYRLLPDAVRARLANPLAPGMAGPLLCWLANHEAYAYQQARWALQPKDWLRLQLTGEVATDPSDASATLLYDLLADEWAEEVITALNLKRHLLPPLRPSAACAGRLSARAAQALGLPAGLPIATGAADTAAAALGSGLLAAGPIQLTLGSGAQFVQICSLPRVDPAGRTHLYRAADGVNWYILAAVQNAGLALNWVCQILRATWDELYASAALPPEPAGPRFLPSLTDERPHHPFPSNRGAFLGLRSDHRREQLLHATLEGVAFGLRIACEALPAAREAGALRLAGGGSEHPAWRQMLADILNRELLAVDVSAASARGAALLGGIVGGAWTDARATAAVAPQISLVAAPDVARAEIYHRLYTEHLEQSAEHRFPQVLSS
jgi:xylulokinase